MKSIGLLSRILFPIEIMGFLAVLTCCPTGRPHQHSLPHICSLLFHCFWAKLGKNICASPGKPVSLPTVQEWPVIKVSVQALPCISALQLSSVQGRVAQVCVDAAVRKIWNSSLSLQSLGAAGISSFFDHPANVVFHSFLTGGYVYMLFFKWMRATFAHSSVRLAVFKFWLVACLAWIRSRVMVTTNMHYSSRGYHSQTLGLILSTHHADRGPLLPLTSADFLQSRVVVSHSLAGIWLLPAVGAQFGMLVSIIPLCSSCTWALPPQQSLQKAECITHIWQQLIPQWLGHFTVAFRTLRSLF